MQETFAELEDFETEAGWKFGNLGNFENLGNSGNLENLHWKKRGQQLEEAEQFHLNRCLECFHWVSANFCSPCKKLKKC